MSNAAIKQMSDTVLFCEIRATWAQIECDIRHGLQSGKRDSDYVAALTAEQARRADSREYLDPTDSPAWY